MSVTENHMKTAVKVLLSGSGDDPDREGLSETPHRFVEAWKFYTKGYSESPESILKTFEDGAQSYSEVVFQGAIPIVSLCEHHLAPFFGSAHVSYLPDGRIVGLSKLARLVEIFSRRLQIQERISYQVADALMEYLKPKGAGVVLQCRHLCMESRGIQKHGTVTQTCALRGAFLDDSTVRSEFMTYVNIASRKSALP